MNTLVQLSAVVNIVAIVLLIVLVKAVLAAWSETKAARKDRDGRYSHEEVASYVLEAYRQALKESAELYKERQGLQGTDGYINALREMYKNASVNGIVADQTADANEEDTQPTPPVEVYNDEPYFDYEPVYN